MPHVSKFRRISPLWLVPAIAISTLAAAGIAAASIPDASGVVHGCYATTSGLAGIPHSKGDTRLVEPGEACRSYEKAASWNAQGVKGATGATGATGPQGPAGPQGESGSVLTATQSAQGNYYESATAFAGENWVGAGDCEGSTADVEVWDSAVNETTLVAVQPGIQSVKQSGRSLLLFDNSSNQLVTAQFTASDGTAATMTASHSSVGTFCTIVVTLTASS